MTSTHWRDRASCLDFDPELWFPVTREERKDGGETARAICRSCPVRLPCLQDANVTDDHLTIGIRGGLDAEERRVLRRRERDRAYKAEVAARKKASA